MRRSVPSLLLLLVCVMLWSGCRGTAPPELPEGEATVWDTGTFRTTVPAGWTAVPVTDPFAPIRDTVDPSSLFVIRGGSTRQELFRCLYVHLMHYGPEDGFTEPTADTCVDVEPLAPRALGDHIWQGLTGIEVQGRATLGRTATLWTHTGDHYIVASVWMERGRDQITLEDADVQAILSGVECVHQ